VYQRQGNGQLRTTVEDVEDEDEVRRTTPKKKKKKKPKKKSQLLSPQRTKDRILLSLCLLPVRRLLLRPQSIPPGATSVSG
jgi:hypothetical protein